MMPQIVLIDDDLHASALRKQVLELKGYRVQMALDAQTGLQFADALRPETVIFDHRFPEAEMQGPALMACVRKLLPKASLISLSSQEGIDHLYDTHPDAVLLKGESVQAMLHCVATLLAK